MKRILLIDESNLDSSFSARTCDEIRSKLAADGIEAEVDTPNFVFNNYQPSDDELRRIGALVGAHAYDAIVVGNNNGAGIKIVESIPTSLRSRIIVTSTFSLRRFYDRYIALGWSGKHAKRGDETEVIKEVVS